MCSVDPKHVKMSENVTCFSVVKSGFVAIHDEI